MRRSTGWILVASACVVLAASAADAAVVCQKGQKVKLRATACKGKEVLAHDLTLLAQPGPKGDPGEPGTARAYAEVDVSDAPNVTLVTARSRGFVAVERTGSGLYCLTPEDGIDPSTSASVASVSGPLTSNSHAYTAPPGVSCPDGFVVAVKEGSTLDSDSNFTIIVP